MISVLEQIVTDEITVRTFRTCAHEHQVLAKGRDARQHPEVGLPSSGVSLTSRASSESAEVGSDGFSAAFRAPGPLNVMVSGKRGKWRENWGSPRELQGRFPRISSLHSPRCPQSDVPLDCVLVPAVWQLLLSCRSCCVCPFSAKA